MTLCIETDIRGDSRLCSSVRGSDKLYFSARQPERELPVKIAAGNWVNPKKEED